MLEPVIARYRERGLALYFRGDAAFAKPELYELLEAEGIGYAIRLPANAVLQERIGHLLTRPVGRPPKKPQVFYASFSYQAQSWSQAAPGGGQGRVAPGRAVPAGRLHRHQPDPAGASGSASSTTAAARRSSGSRRASWRCAGPGCPAAPSATTRCGCSCSRSPTTWPTSCASLALPHEVAQWSLTTLREKLVKIGARIVRHGRYVVFQLAEVAVPRALFAAILRRIDRLRGPPVAAA